MVIPSQESAHYSDALALNPRQGGFQHRRVCPIAYAGLYFLEELAPVLVRSLPALTLGLYPATARPGSIDGVLSLRDDPLKAQALAFGHQGHGVAETLAVADQPALAAGQQ